MIAAIAGGRPTHRPAAAAGAAAATGVSGGAAPRSLAGVSLRWWADGSAGLRFESPQNLRELTELLERAGRDGSGLYYERRIGDLLEGVAANDPGG